jgi:hypothetical protein
MTSAIPTRLGGGWIRLTCAVIPWSFLLRPIHSVEVTGSNPVRPTLRGSDRPRESSGTEAHHVLEVSAV